MPIDPTRSPLMDAMYQGNPNAENGTLMTQDELMELQREQEQRLISSMFIQSIFLALSIMLYDSWQWASYFKVYESAIFFGVMAFAVQAGMYFTYRTMFEDSANHRKESKRMRRRMKSKMSKVKYELDSRRSEMLLEHQMNTLMAQHEMSMVDGVQTPQEQAMIQQTQAQINSQFSQEQVAAMAKELGMDRHRIGPIPLGPVLTYTQPPLGQQMVEPPSNKANLDPTNQN